MNPLLHLIRRFFHRRSNDRGEEDARLTWPEARLFEQEKEEFVKAHSQYLALIMALMSSSHAEYNGIALKHHQNAFEILYMAQTRVDNYHDLAEHRQALSKIIKKLEAERDSFGF